MLLLGISLLVDAVCLLIFFGPIEWMYRRGWRVWPRLFAFIFFLPMALIPVVTPIPSGKSALTLPLALALFFGGATTLVIFAFFPSVLKGIKPSSAYGAAREDSLKWIEKRASPFILLSPAIALTFVLTGLGVSEVTALTVCGYVGLPCWAFGQYLLPTKRAKALRNYGSVRYIMRTLTRPVVISLSIICVIGGAASYSFGAAPEAAPLWGLGVVLFVWRWSLRPVRDDEYDFPIEVSYWHAMDLASEIDAEIEEIIDALPSDYVIFNDGAEGGATPIWTLD